MATTTVFFRLKSETRRPEPRRVTVPSADLSWPTVRYAIERKLHMHDRRARHATYEYADGYIQQAVGGGASPTALGDQDTVAPYSGIVVVRRPMSEGGRPFVPAHCQRHTQTDVALCARGKERHTIASRKKCESSTPATAEWRTLSEASRIEALVRQQPEVVDQTREHKRNDKFENNDRFDRGERGTRGGGLQQTREHASSLRERRAAGIRPIPNDPNYVCDCCGEARLHFSGDCPMLEIHAFVPMYKRRRIAGIPRERQRPAVTDEERMRAHIGRNGELVVITPPTQ